jgi:hypothetical protein
VTSRPAERIYTEPDSTGLEPSVTELVLEWDGTSAAQVLRLLPADREGVLAALADPKGLARLMLRVQGITASARLGAGPCPPAARRELDEKLALLVRDAHSEGFAQGVHAVLGDDEAVRARDFLQTFLDQSRDLDHGDVEAIERVRALLES